MSPKKRVPVGGVAEVKVGGKKYELSGAGYTKATAKKRAVAIRGMGMKAVSRRYETPNRKVRYSVFYRKSK